ncbi:MAG: hypothetical protein WBE34_11740 [Candidatus Nitrosopolaris sp.]
MNKSLIIVAIFAAIPLLLLSFITHANAFVMTPQQKDCVQKIVEGMLIFGAGSSSTAVEDNVNAIEKCLQ